MDDERYVCYVLRLWRSSADAASPWRASLEDVHSGQRLGFGDLEALCAFVVARAGEAGVGQARSETEDKR